MAAELWLGEPRPVLDEPGAALVYDFGRRDPAGLATRVARGELRLTGCVHEPVGGHVVVMPEWALAATTHATWTTEGSDWVLPDEEPEAAQSPWGGRWARAMAHVGSSACGLVSREPWPAGQGAFVQWLAYDQAAGPLALELEFGGVWRLEVGQDGLALLSRRVGEAWQPWQRFAWLGRPAVPLERHTLWIYEVGPKLVVRSLDVPLSDASRGVALRDPEAAADPPDSEAYHALQAGAWRVRGVGPVVVACAQQHWLAGQVTVETAAAEPLGAWLGARQAARVGVWGWALGEVAPTVELWDDQGRPYPRWPAAAAAEPATGLRWRVQWSSTTTARYALAGVTVALPPTHRWTAGPGVNLLALPGVADREITVARGGPPGSELLRAELVSLAGDLAAWCTPNQALRYTVDGLTRFRGLTDQAEWRHVAGELPPTGELLLRARGLDKVWDKALWPGGEPFDGRPLSDCLGELARAAGLAPARVAIAPDPFRLPTAPEGEPPTLQYRPGTRLRAILDDLRRCWFGAWLACGWRLSDGAWQAGLVGPPGPPEATFWHTAAAAAAAGSPGRVILAGSYRETLDERELANVVTVLGQSPDGAPLVARCVDWASIGDPVAANYVGEPWPLLLRDPALSTQAAVNLVCRLRFEQVRWPRAWAEFASVRVDLQPGAIVRLVGCGGAVLYRLLALSARGAAEGDAADPQGRATYLLEKLR